ncbi:transketolase C-terminal domain-containing protein, partial [Actinomadura rubrisoli]
GLRLAAPRDPARLRELLGEAVDTADAPTAIRFPKGSTGPDVDAVTRMDGLDILHRSRRLPLQVLLVATGVMAGPALQAAQRLDRDGVGVTVVDPRWVLPVHPTLIHLAARHRLVITLEDATSAGGIGTAVTQACTDAEVSAPVRNLGLPRAFIPAGSRQQLLDQAGLTSDPIIDVVRKALPVAAGHRTASLGLAAIEPGGPSRPAFPSPRREAP